MADNEQHMDVALDDAPDYIAELEAELYSRVHHDQPETTGVVNESAPAIKPGVTKNRILTKHTMVVKAVRDRKRKFTKEVCNPNPFAIVSANNKNPISKPKRLTPYTSYLSQFDSKPTPVKENNQHPNPFNRMNEEKIKHLQSLRRKKDRTDESSKNVKKTADNVDVKPFDIPIPISVDSDSDDDVIVVPAVPQPIYNIDSSDEENISPKANEQNINVSDELACTFIDINNDPPHLKHDDPFGGIDASELNEIVTSVDDALRSHANEPIHDFAQPQRKKKSKNKSYEVAENDFAATDVYESESSDLPEGVYSKGKKVSTVHSDTESDDSEIEISNRSKRMRKRKSSGSNRGSDYISHDSDEDMNVIDKRLVVYRGEAIHNAITTRKSKKVINNTERESDQEFVTLLSRICDKDKEPSQKNDREDDSSTGTDNETAKNAKIVSSDWIVKDQVGVPDDVELATVAEKNCESTLTERICDNENNESNARDKDDTNCVRSKTSVVHPEMGWNYEMRAFYHESWGGETHDSVALRKQMPSDLIEWPINQADRHVNNNRLKNGKCMNCREYGHRYQFCPQPKREIVCYTCGGAGHREARCPNAICLKCGQKSNSYRRNCERCRFLDSINCSKCKARGHMHRDCPDHWRSYHNTVDPVSSPKYLANNIRPKKYCSVCAAAGHTAEVCYDALRLIGEELPSTRVRKYEPVYNSHLQQIDNSKTMPYVMFENPRENFEFSWTVNESEDRCYGRFMAAAKIKRNRMVNILAKQRANKAKRRRLNDDVEIKSTNEHLVLNPMNPKNKRNADKPKKQFSKDFYIEPVTSTTKIGDDVQNSHDDTVAGAIISPESDINDSVCVDKALNTSHNSNVDMEDTEIDKSNNENTNEDNIDSCCLDEGSENKELRKSTENALLNEANEVDKLKGLTTFSFIKEMEELEKSKSKNAFDLSFIGAESSVADKDEVTKSEKIINQNEIEMKELSEVEDSLNKLKERLTTMKKPRDNIVLNISNATGNSGDYDSDSNYSFGEYFDQSKVNENEDESDENGMALPEYISLSSTRIESPDNMDDNDASGISQSCVDPLPTKAVSEAKIFLTKEHTRMLLTEVGNRFLRESSTANQIKVSMQWESVGNVLLVVGAKLHQDKFHADLVQYLENMNKKVQQRNDTLQLLPKSKVGLIRFIREQLNLLEEPLGNVHELYNNMIMNEKSKTKTGTKNADKSRKKLNTILMGRAGLCDGPLHLSGLQNNLKFLLETPKIMMTRHLREEVYQHYRYLFSPWSHENYPELITAYNTLKKTNSFPPINIDRRLMELKISTQGGNVSNSLEVVKQKLMRIKPEESPGRRSKLMQEKKSPKPEPKSPKIHKTETVNTDETSPAVENINPDIEAKNKNSIWSFKSKEIIEKCRQKPNIASSVLEKFNILLEKANRNELNYNDFINLSKIEMSLNSKTN